MPNRIGDFLVKIDAMTLEQVDHVLRLQAEGDSRIFGEIALELKYLNDDAIKRYVDHLATSKEAIQPDSDIEEL